MKLNLSLGVLAALQLTASLLIQLTVLRLVGAGPETDAFVAAQAGPLVLFAILSVSLHSVWQPRLSVVADDVARWRELQGVAQGQVLITFGSLALVLCVSAPLWIPHLFPGFEHAQVLLTTAMSLPLFVATALNGHSTLFTTALRSRDRFVAAEVVALGGTLISLALIAVTVPWAGVKAAPWCILARALAVSAILHVRAGRPAPNLRKAWSSGEVWQQLRPLLAGSSLYKTAPLIDRYWSSQAAAGGVTVLSLAQTGMGALAAVLERAFCVPVAPQLGRLVGRADYVQLRSVCRRAIKRVTIATVLIAAALGASHPLWVPALGALLKLSPQVATQMWLICMLLIGYLHVASSGTVVVAAFYAMGNTRTPVRIGIAGFLIGVVLKSVGFVMYGLPGLALATSTYYVGNFLTTWLFLEKTIHARLS